MKAIPSATCRGQHGVRQATDVKIRDLFKRIFGFWIIKRQKEIDHLLTRWLMWLSGKIHCCFCMNIVLGQMFSYIPEKCDTQGRGAPGSRQKCEIYVRFTCTFVPLHLFTLHNRNNINNKSLYESLFFAIFAFTFCFEALLIASAFEVIRHTQVFTKL